MTDLIVEPTRAPYYLLANFRTPDGIHEAFTEGDCWALAIALSKITGWQIVTCTEDGDGDGNFAGYWCHVGVMHPNGIHVVDIEGVSQVESWLDRWAVYLPAGNAVSVEWSLKEFQRNIRKDEQERYFRAVPLVWAKKIVAALDSIQFEG